MGFDFKNYGEYIDASGSVEDNSGVCAGVSYGYCIGSRPPTTYIQVTFTRTNPLKKLDIRYTAQVAPTCDRHYYTKGGDKAQLDRPQRLLLLDFLVNTLRHLVDYFLINHHLDLMTGIQ